MQSSALAQWLESAAPEAVTVKVWDPLVRVLHWTLVLAFSMAWLTAENESVGFHSGAGYVILGVVAVRLVWGIVGTRHARFASFVRHPREALRYLLDLLHLRGRAHVGHNPAAAWMVLALLMSLSLTGVTGAMLYGAEEGAGPLGVLMPSLGEGDDLPGDFLEDIHETLAGFTLFLVGFHVAGVMASSLIHRENLVRAMITGKKLMHGVTADTSTATPRGTGAAWAAGALLAVGLGVALGMAPGTSGLAMAAPASAVNERLAEYRAKGAGPFSAEAGRRLFEANYTVQGETRNCAACHTTDLKKKGKHNETGKPIDPLAPSVQTDRLTDSAKIEKWFLRNCKWTIGRPCTPQEKGDVLTFLQTQ